MYHPKLITN